jgi:hypothetical protein
MVRPKVRACDAAEQILREQGKTEVCWGDLDLLYSIGERMGYTEKNKRTARLVLNHLSSHPGNLKMAKTRRPVHSTFHGVQLKLVRAFQLRD